MIVDDGSRDGTGARAAELATQHGIDLTVLRHERNAGPGRAFATGFEFLAGRLADDDWVLTLEGDNTSRLELVRTMLRRAREEGYEVVLASPYLYGGGVVQTTLPRVVLSKIANLFIKELLGLHGLVTVSSFFRLYRGSIVRRLQERYGPTVLERSGFECMVELLIKLVSLEASISEVPMVLDTSRRAGKSKMKVLRTIRGYVAVWLRRRRWVGPRRAEARRLVRP